MSDNNLTATQFAELIGVQRSSISHLLSERNKPSLELVMKILTRFPEISPEWLLFGKSPTLFSNTSPIEKTTPSLSSVIIEEKTNPLPTNDLFSTTSLPNEKTEPIKSISEPLPLLPPIQTDSLQKDKQLIKIVFFYSNGTFEAFQP